MAGNTRDSGTIRQARRERGNSASRVPVLATAMLALALTVPALTDKALAEPGAWDLFSALGIGSETASAERLPMPFETAGESFPGSAFFYLEDAPRIAPGREALRADRSASESAADFSSHSSQPEIARSFANAGSGLDKARALQCLSLAVYYEAATESHDGQRAVAQVVLNRVAHPAYPSSVCGVVFQGSERRTGCQFAFTCDGSLARKPSRRNWAEAQSVALGALSGETYAPVGTATHYHATYVSPYWAPSLDPVTTIGLHSFYRWKGRAGKADAFSMSYRGNEPLAAPIAPPRPSRALPIIGETAAASTPVVPAAPAPAREAAADAPSPSAKAVAGDRLPSAGTVRPEYARSGRWISEPGTSGRAR